MQVQLQLWIGEVMLQMGRKTLKVVSALLFVALLAGIFTAVALAGHTHTTGEWYHGLGDGDNNNSYVHPFVDNTAGHVHSPGVNYYLSGEVRWLEQSSRSRSNQLLRALEAESSFVSNTSPTRMSTTVASFASPASSFPGSARPSSTSRLSSAKRSGR